MSPRYHNDDVDKVRDRADIIEIIGEHVRLKKAGQEYRGLCPFHQEKTPSFYVNQDKKVYTCRGCGAGGSIFTFLEQSEGLSFPEAVEMLAQRYGIELREFAGGKKVPSKRSRLLELHEAAVQHYQELLASKEGEPIRNYLGSRGMGADVIDRFKIGFGGWKRSTLVAAMQRRGFTAEELTTSGLATRGARGTTDTFSGRVLFPIFDPSSRPVAFGGRIVPPEYRPDDLPEGPKYLNSRESPIFKKSKILYGANWARPQVVQSRRLVLVEGYTDCIALHMAGIGEAVATCGTSLTEDHMKEISTRFGDVTVILCLDADNAGKQAMSKERTEELADTYSPGGMARGSGWLPIGRGWLPEVHVANLPDGKDPADFVREDGPEGIARVLDASLPLVDFVLRRALEGSPMKTLEDRMRAVRNGVEVLKQIDSSLIRNEYLFSLADRVSMPIDDVRRELHAAMGATKRRAPSGPQPSAPIKVTGHHKIEREALRALITYPVLFDDPQLSPTKDDFTLPVHLSIFRMASQERTGSGAVDLGRLASHVDDAELRQVATELSMGEVPDERVARDTLVRLKVFTLERYIVERKERLRGLDPNRDAVAYDALFEELLGVEKEKRALGESGS